MNVFADYHELEAAVETTYPVLQEQVLAAYREVRDTGIRHTVREDATYIGDLHFAGVKVFSAVYPPKTVKVFFFLSYWGLIYEYRGRLYNNDNGSVFALLRHSDPHGLPTAGSWFKPALPSEVRE